MIALVTDIHPPGFSNGKKEQHASMGISRLVQHRNQERRTDPVLELFQLQHSQYPVIVLSQGLELGGGDVPVLAVVLAVYPVGGSSPRLGAVVPGSQW